MFDKITDGLYVALVWIGNVLRIHGKALMFGVVVAGASLASMKHIYDFASFFNAGAFAYGFMVAMELGFIGATVIYSLESMAEDAKKEKHEGNAFWRWINSLFSGGATDLRTRTRNMLATCVGVLFLLQYIMNTFSSYLWLRQNHPTFVDVEASWFAALYGVGFIQNPDFQVMVNEVISIVLAHIAGATLPFLAFFFSKAVALAVSESRGKADYDALYAPVGGSSPDPEADDLCEGEGLSEEGFKAAWDLMEGSGITVPGRGFEEDREGPFPTEGDLELYPDGEKPIFEGIYGLQGPEDVSEVAKDLMEEKGVTILEVGVEESDKATSPPGELTSITLDEAEEFAEVTGGLDEVEGEREPPQPAQEEEDVTSPDLPSPGPEFVEDSGGGGDGFRGE